MKTSVIKMQHLSRRLLANYLLFGLLSIVALATGLVLIINFSATSTGGDRLLSRLGTAASQITRDYDTRGGAGVPAIVQELGESADLEFCCVISDDGVYLAHSNTQLVGRKVPRTFSTANAPGVIERVSYLREGNSGRSEYWLPLRGDQQTYGMLQVAARQGDSKDWLNTLGRHAGTAVVVPLILLLAGGFKLNQLVKASSAIERQLANLASADATAPLQLKPVEECGAAGVGWNQLVARSSKGHLLENLKVRLDEALGGFREEKYEHLLQGLTDGVAATNERGVITFANKAFAVLLHASPESIRGMEIENLVMQDLSHNLENFQRKMREPSRPSVVELARSGDVEDGVLRLARFPLRADDGKTVTHVWSLRDITQQKLVEHARDQFVDTATHELRTPLSTIKACAETLEMEEDVDVELQKKYLNTINMEASRLGRFVDEFLNISRMEAGSLALNRHEVDFDRLLSDVIEKARPQMLQKQLDFQVLLPPKIPKLNIDKDKISAALVNLLGNAAKYTPEGGRVTLQVEADNQGIRAHVEDTGIGIAVEEQAKVFTKFFRSDDDRVRDITGTGLGLAFAQEVTRLHGGKISVRSEIEHGSRFTLSLPLA